MPVLPLFTDDFDQSHYKLAELIIKSTAEFSALQHELIILCLQLLFFFLQENSQVLEHMFWLIDRLNNSKVVLIKPFLSKSYALSSIHLYEGTHILQNQLLHYLGISTSQVTFPQIINPSKYILSYCWYLKEHMKALLIITLNLW